jgi:methylthioribose-1-phosphate isomerase
LIKPIEWLPERKVRFLDQTRLPGEEVWIETDDYHAVAEAIRRLQVRGAPLIGISAAYALVLAAYSAARQPQSFRQRLAAAAEELRSARPTAVNLTWAIDRLLACLPDPVEASQAADALLKEALRIHEEDIAANLRMADNGAALLPEGARVLTHCNTGSLATGGYGTALGVIRSAFAQGKIERVYLDETRPLLQGSRLTTWELLRDGIPHTLIVDNAAGALMKRGLIDAVIVGADRITANGDVANKIGTYQLAVLARENGLPFYVAAPTSTVDLALSSGEAVPIEERSAAEVTGLFGIVVAPPGVEAANPAFDVTPNEYVSAVVTENGVAKAPYTESLARLCRMGVAAHG